MQGHGHGLVGIGPQAEGEIVRLALPAVEHQGIGLRGAFHAVGDGLESIGAIEVIENPLDNGPVIEAVGGHVVLVVDAGLLMRADAVETDFLHPDLSLRQVHRRGMGGDAGIGLVGNRLGDGFEQFLVLQRIPVSLRDDIVHALLVKGKHGVAFEFVMDAEIQHLPGGAVG